jgi:filamentous hemagglutinin
MASAHAEIGAIQQAYDMGLTQGTTMTINVTGQTVCSYCKSDIRHMADAAGLTQLRVFEAVSGRTFTWTRNADGNMGRYVQTD